MAASLPRRFRSTLAERQISISAIISLPWFLLPLLFLVQDGIVESAVVRLLPSRAVEIFVCQSATGEPLLNVAVSSKGGNDLLQTGAGFEMLVLTRAPPVRIFCRGIPLWMPCSERGGDGIVWNQLYRGRAKEARDMAASASDHDAQRLWREIAEAFEELADLPAQDGLWVVEKVGK
jgi:hypothetical protein